MNKARVLKKLIVPATIAAGAFFGAYNFSTERETAPVAKRASELNEDNEAYSSIGYKVYDGNSKLKDAKVVLLGEGHFMHDREHSDFFKHYIRDGDSVLLEGAPMKENLEEMVKRSADISTAEEMLRKMSNPDLETKVTIWCLIYPKFYGIKISGKKVSVEGAEDMEAYRETAKALYKLEQLKQRDIKEPKENCSEADNKAYCETLLEWFRLHRETTSELDKLNAKREKGFVDSITASLEKCRGKVYFIVGLQHIKDRNLTNALKAKGINYCALVPKREGPLSKDDAKKYCLMIAETASAPKEDEELSNVVLTVKLPDGRTDFLCYSYFGQNGTKYDISQAAKIREGDEVEFVEKDHSLHDYLFSEGFVTGDKYRVTEIKKITTKEQEKSVVIAPKEAAK